MVNNLQNFINEIKDFINNFLLIFPSEIQTLLTIGIGFSIALYIYKLLR